METERQRERVYKNERDGNREWERESASKKEKERASEVERGGKVCIRKRKREEKSD